MIAGKNNIVWIASYPKSGNTWLRVFLVNILKKSKKPIDINDLELIPNASSRSYFDRISGIYSSNFSNDELSILRPFIYRQLSYESNQTLYFKVHDMWSKNRNGDSLFPYDATKCVLYLVRNPLDVAVSYANHMSCSIDYALKTLCNKNHGLCSDPARLYFQFNQTLSSWSEHIISWVDKSNLPVHVIRYEDMLENPIDTFGKALKFLGIRTPYRDLLKALEFSNFNELKRQEELSGFREKPIGTKEFFRKGAANSYKSENVKKSIIENFIEENDQVMKRFSYLYK
jgi:hypothetical protein